MEQNSYGSKIRKVRVLRGYSQEYMAEQLGLGSAKSYGRYETGEAKLDMPHLESIAKVLGMTLMDLLSFDEKAFFAHCNQANPFGSNITYTEASQALVDELHARIKHLEEEVFHLRKSEEFLREQLKAAMEARK